MSYVSHSKGFSGSERRAGGEALVGRSRVS
jgi:hypothetical protein